MALLRRIARWLRDNFEGLAAKPENPEERVGELIRSMEEALKALKGRAAASMADKRSMESRLRENREKTAEWMRRAEACVEKGEELPARTALEHYLSHERLAADVERQLAEQDRQVEELTALLQRLKLQLTEARSAGELLLAEHRRARLPNGTSGGGIGGVGEAPSFDRLHHMARDFEEAARMPIDPAMEGPEEKVDRIVKDAQIDALMEEIRARRRMEDL